MEEVKLVRMEGYEPEQVVRLLTPLIEDSVSHGFRMLRTLASEMQSGANRFDKPGEALIGMMSKSSTLVAVGGLNRDPYGQNPQIGRVRRVYVHSSYRRLGYGREIMYEVLNLARSALYEDLVLRATEKQAFDFYESLGFIRVFEDVSITHCMKLWA